MADTRFGAVFFTSQLNTTRLPCADLQEIGVRSTFFGAWWGQIERRPGEYDWSSVDGPVDAALGCGIEPMIKITVAARPGEASQPPENMEAYSRFVSALVQHFRGRVRSYAIENEINSWRLTWTGQTYGALRATAYEAIKDADPGAQVLDSGLIMMAYIVARANELKQAGQTGEALAMLNRFEQGMRRKDYALPDTEEQLTKWLSDPNYQRAVGLVDELFAHPETYDALQVHYLQDAWELIPEHVSWLRGWLAEAGVPDKPLEFWEIGYGWSGEKAGIPYTEEDHAQGVVKTLVTALGEGGSRVLYEPYWEPRLSEDEAPQVERKFGRGMVTADGPRLSKTSYTTLTSQLAGYQKAERFDPAGTGPSGESLGAGVWAYRFSTPRGDVYVVWAEQETTVQLPLDAAQVTVMDILGAASQADTATVAVGISPVFVSAGTSAVLTPAPTASATAAPAPTQVPTAVPTTAAGTLEARTVTVEGMQRTYHLYVPTNLPVGQPVPLVLAFHPRGVDGSGLAFAEKTGFAQLADEEGFIVVFPDGINSKWMDGNPDIDPVYENDLPFVEAVLDEVGRAHPIDPKRIFATGHSNGAAFSQYLAMHMPDRIAAIGCSGAGLAETWQDDLAAAGTFSVIMSCGSNDPFCDKPVDGAGNLQFAYLMRIEPTSNAFVSHNACGTTGQETLLPDLDPGDRCRVTQTEWKGCEAGTEVELLYAEGAGHDWYRSGVSTSRCRDIDNTRLFWEFFESHPKQ